MGKDRRLKSADTHRHRALLFVLCMAIMQSTAAKTPYPVTVVSIHKTPWETHQRVLGIVSGMGHVLLTTPISGIPDPYHLETGDTVHPGERITTIRAPQLTHRIEALKAQLALAIKLHHHIQVLRQQKLATTSQMQTAASKVRVDKTQLNALLAEKKMATLRSPIAGTLEILEPAGHYVGRNTPIARIAGKPRLIWIKAWIPADHATTLHTGIQCTWQRHSQEGRARLYGITQSVSTLGLIPIYARPQHPDQLLIGEYVWLSVPTQKGWGWQVPRNSIIDRKAKSFIYLAKGGHSAIRLPIHVLSVDHQWAWVKSKKLHTGDRVILKGVTAVTKQASITIQHVDSHTRME